MPDINAFVFDLDGTLVQTERLKARSYAKAAVALCPEDVTEDDVMEAYKDVVGESRQVVATTLMERSGLEAVSAEHMTEIGVDAPWQAFVQVRLGYYHDLVGDPDVLRENRWPHSLALLERARENQCAVALATTSRRTQACHVLDVLGHDDTFDFVATADDVARTKPHPEIYRMCAVELGVAPERILAIEDSPTGTEAALAAGLHCIAFGTPFTEARLQAESSLDDRWIVTDPNDLLNTVDTLLEEPALSK
ncbi:HAD family hydrolase [Salinibacter altiplanensis]|uniref:HAD family hydrolase n=1 Tax=Salinibacter altiplanensis TaxID=1803181 RepID=UPI000C9F1821|nr:HAD family phosphatase [Salinibacter altiplanensis]